MINYSYIKNNVNSDKLFAELKLISNKITGISFSISTSELKVHASFELTESELNSVEAQVLSHDYTDPVQVARTLINEAMLFGNELIITFAYENVLMGITQNNKTKAVADYLANLIRYTQTGSLYEVINEIDRLINEGLPVELEPYITETRLLNFRQKILDYLQS